MHPKERLMGGVSCGANGIYLLLFEASVTQGVKIKN